MKQITVIGAGAWGTALALALHHSGANVTLYSRKEEIVGAITREHQNTRHLPGIPLPAAINATTSLETALNAELLVVTTPSQFLREGCQKLQEAGLAEDIPLLLCCKGIEKGSLMLMSEIIAEIMPATPVAALSGPNFADEVAKGLPAATTIACEDATLGRQLVQLFSHSTLRPYYSPDITGAEIGGAVKNVLAIACGIVMGKVLGENAKAALITRGLAEMMRLGSAKGAKMETLMGLSGVGDLLLTCSSAKSRNMSLGLLLGQGKTLQDILANRASITEGVASAESVTQLARKLGIEMPICEAVYRVLYERMSVDVAIQGLLQRPLTEEFTG